MLWRALCPQSQQAASAGLMSKTPHMASPMTSPTSVLCLPPGTWVTRGRAAETQELLFTCTTSLGKHLSPSESRRCPRANHTQGCARTTAMTVPSLKDQVPGASCPDLGNKAPSPSAIDFCLLFACRVSEASLGPNAAAEWRPAALLGSLTFGRQCSCCSPPSRY